MRWLLGAVLVWALCVISCSETSGTEGMAGAGGQAGWGGDGGSAGDGGHGGGGDGGDGDGGSDGDPSNPCAGVDEIPALCVGGFCVDESCVPEGCAEADEGARCARFNAPGFNKDWYFGFCVAGSCEYECTVLADGDECLTTVYFYSPESSSVCRDGLCVVTDCSRDAQFVPCVEGEDIGSCYRGVCVVESCTSKQDGTPCFSGPEIGTCEAGVCELG